MSATVIHAENTEDIDDVVFRVVAAIAQGQVVAIPTETVYGLAASALYEDAVRRLLATKGRSFDQPLALAVKSVDDALDYVPNMSPLARRLARRCWPGPVTLVLDHDHPDSVITRLPEFVQSVTLSSGDPQPADSNQTGPDLAKRVAGRTVGLRVPANSTALQVLRFSAGPLVLTSANLSGEADMVTGSQVVEHFKDKIDLIVDEGACRFGQASTVVRVRNHHYQLLREGVVSETTIKRMSMFQALIVCTGNTCRSPMAELLLKRQLAGKLNCQIEELPEKGFQINSAGIAATPGNQPSPQSVAVLSEMGLDLNSHQSQPVSEHLVKSADLVLTMTSGHLAALLSQWPSLNGRAFVLRKDNADVSDPIGQSDDVYKRCAQQIDEHASQWAEQIIESAGNF